LKRGRAKSFLLRSVVGGLLLLSLGAPARIADQVAEARSADAAAQVRWQRLSALTTADNGKILDVGETAEQLNAAIPFSAVPVETMGAFRAIPKSSPAYATALTCLTQAIYYEAANEPLTGKRGVAQVVLNRLRHPAYPATVCGVVYEGWDRPVCQFSFVCDGSLQRAPMAMQWRQSRDVAAAALAGFVERSVGSATHYHADYVLPRWAYTLAKVSQIGRHIFYRFPGSGGRMATFSARWAAREQIPQVDLARFDGEILPEDATLQLAGLGSYEARDPTDRRADNDLGGRIDPSKTWRLTIPDPGSASSTYNASLRTQIGDGVAQHDTASIGPAGEPTS
jgi:spore germination cell wall hydrolase CwlJ-like protein